MTQFSIRSFAALLVCLAGPALAQTTLTGDYIIEGDLTVDLGSTGSLYVEDDSVIDGSLCLGNVCSPTTTFANDETLVMKYTQHSIVFDDTSSSTSPNNDWIIRVNDPQARADGGIDKFAIEDTTAGTTPFTLQAGIPDNAFWMAPSGNLGLGTSIPTANLHVAGASPRILVEASGGSSAVREMFNMTNNGGSYFTLANSSSGTTWYFTHEQAAPNRFIITDGVADGPEMTLTADGDLTIQGQLFTAGSCASGCDRVFDADYPLPSIAEQAAQMKALKHLPNVGPTPEDGPFNLTKMTGGMLNELEKAHLYIAELHDTVAAERARNAEQEARIARLEALVESLASR
ncbi:hypothetical protein [Tropicibacter sp. S64]|uniref:hypothetical protein n=1 Tax=Tropicibacter sp. S64 TaxID=3415122 RepID=UPI003C7A5CE5